MATYSATENIRDIELRRRGLAASAFLFIYLLLLALLNGKLRRWIAEALVYTMLISLCPPGLQVHPAAVPVSTWAGLSDAFSAGGDYVLNEDIIAPVGAEGFMVVKGTALNLNGHTIDAAGNITDSAVINVYNSLTITNESGLSAPLGGYIKGGYNSRGNGGGIYVAKGAVLNMDGGAIIDCTAKNGGGIYSEGDLYFNGGKVGEQGHGNHAIENGGGIYIEKREVFTFGNAIIVGNDAGEQGGGLYVDNAEVISGDEGANNDDSSGSGENTGRGTNDPEEGAATVSEDSVSSDNAKFNESSNGEENSVSDDRIERIGLRNGALSIQNNNSYGDYYDDIHDQTSVSGYGGGVNFLNGGHSANTYYSFTNIYNNNATYGGGVAFGQGGSIPASGTDPGAGIMITSGWIKASGVHNNTAEEYGGGLYIGHRIPNDDHYTTGISCVFYNTEICSNSAKYGGGVSISGANNTWRDGKIYANHATCSGGLGGSGGGIYGGKSHSFMKDIIVDNNVADKEGGGIYVEETIQMYGGSITNNRSEKCAIAAERGGTLSGYGNLDGNTASGDGNFGLEIGGSGHFNSLICRGGTLSVKNGDGVITRCTGITVDNGSFSVGNCLIVDSSGSLTCSSGSTLEVSGGSGLICRRGANLSMSGAMIKARGCSNGGIEVNQSLSNCYGTIICEDCTSDNGNPVLKLSGIDAAGDMDIIIRNCSGTGSLMTTSGGISNINNITLEDNVVTGDTVTGGIINAGDNNKVELSSLNARGNRIGETSLYVRGGLINLNTRELEVNSSYSIKDNIIGGSSTSTIGGLIYAPGLTLSGSGQITDNLIGGDPSAYGQEAPVYVAGSDKNLNLSGTPVIAGNTYLNSEGKRKESNVGLGSSCKINVTTRPLGSGSLVSISPLGSLPGSETDDPVDIAALFGPDSYSAGIIVCDDEHLYFLPGTTAVGYHDHVWSYSSDGSSVSAHCATHGCRYENIVMTLNPPESSIYDGAPKAVTLTGNYPVADISDLAPAPEGVVYYKTEESGSTTPFGSPLSGPPSDRGCYVAMFTWAGKTGVLAFSIGEPKVPLIGNSKYASSKDNFAPLSPKGKISKQQLDFSMVKGSGVNPKDLRMTAIKGSKFTTVAKIAEGKTAKSTGSVKVKVNKKTRTATVKCKKTGKGTVTLPMEDGVTYTITFTVDKPKGMNTTIPVGSSSVTMTTKDMFNTDIDSGDLTVSSKKGVSKASVSADNVLIIDPNGRDTLKVRYKYMNKKYKATVKVK